MQGKLVLKDFNIENEAGGPGKPIVKNFTAAVTSHTLKIHFYWAGKGTTGIPLRGVYGPLVSAISVDPSKLVSTSLTVQRIKNILFLNAALYLDWEYIMTQTEELRKTLCLSHKILYEAPNSKLFDCSIS